jgi:hypothetical protein
MLFIIVNIILYIKTPEPQEVRRGVQRRVDAHGRHEHAHLVPACQQVRGNPPMPQATYGAPAKPQFRTIPGVPYRSVHVGFTSPVHAWGGET